MHVHMFTYVYGGHLPQLGVSSYFSTDNITRQNGSRGAIHLDRRIHHCDKLNLIEYLVLTSGCDRGLQSIGVYDTSRLPLGSRVPFRRLLIIAVYRQNGLPSDVGICSHR